MKYRITLDEAQIERIMKLVYMSENQVDRELYEHLVDQYSSADRANASTKKRSAGAANATATREKRAKKALEDAVNMLRLYNKPITKAEVHRESGVSRNTINKYWDQIV